MTDRLDEVLAQFARKPISTVNKQVWLDGLKSLRSLTETALRAQIVDGVVRIEDGSLTLTEPDFGQYAAPSWRIHFVDRATIDFLPRGGQIVGAVHRGKRLTRLRGRVDLTLSGSGQTTALFLTDSDGSLAWEHMPQDNASQLESLTGTALRELLAAMLQKTMQVPG